MIRNLSNKQFILRKGAGKIKVLKLLLETVRNYNKMTALICKLKVMKLGHFFFLFLNYLKHAHRYSTDKQMYIYYSSNQ